MGIGTVTKKGDVRKKKARLDLNADSFTYQISNGSLASNTATVGLSLKFSCLPSRAGC